MKLGAKQAKLVQKFVPQSRIGIFLNNAPDPPHWTLNSYFGVSCTIWINLGPFGCLTKLSAKWAELMQKYVTWSRVIIFRNEHTRLSPLGAKLMFWCISYYLGAFGAVWLPYKTRCKTSRNGAKVRAMKSGRNFSQNPLDPPYRTLTSFLVRFVLFGSIWDSLVALQHSVQNGPNWCKSPCHEVASEFFATNAPDPPPLHSKHMFWCILYYLDVFGNVWLPYKT